MLILALLEKPELIILDEKAHNRIQVLNYSQINH